jgi:hypothetical protein
LGAADAELANVGPGGAAFGAGTTNGTTSIRQRKLPEPPDRLPTCRALRSGKPANKFWAVSRRGTLRSTARMALTVLPTSAPIAVSVTASMLMATRTSINVKPAFAVGRRCAPHTRLHLSSPRLMRNDIDAPGEPINPNLITKTETRKRDYAAA